MSFSEIIVTLIVAIIFIGPKEWHIVAKFIRDITKKFKILRMETQEIFSEFIDEPLAKNLEKEIKKIQGDDGKFYDSYEIEDPYKEHKISDTRKENE